MKKVLPLLVLLLAGLPACASAQANPDSVRFRNQCRLASRVIETGHPAPQRDWAYEFITRCGREGGNALAASLRSHRNVQEVSDLDALTRGLRTFRDAAVLEASLEIAKDKTASTPARVFAFRTLITVLSPGRSLTYANVTGSAAQCFGLPASQHDEIVEGAPLPPDAQDAIHLTAAEVLRDRATESADVVNAARCAAQYVRWVSTADPPTTL